MSPVLIQLENFLQALSAGLFTGGDLWPDVRRVSSIIFGVMRVINFASGRSHDARHVLRLLRVQRLLGLGKALRPAVGSIVAALLDRAGHVRGRPVPAQLLVSRVTGVKVAGLEGEGHYAQLDPHARHGADHLERRAVLFGSTPVSIRTPLSSSAWQLGPLSARTCSSLLNKARRDRPDRLAGGGGRPMLLHLVVAAGQVAARCRRQSGGRDLHGDRRRQGAPARIRLRRRHHGHRRRAGCARCYPFQPYVGLEFVIVMYAGVVLGGLGCDRRRVLRRPDHRRGAAARRPWCCRTNCRTPRFSWSSCSSCFCGRKACSAST